MRAFGYHGNQTFDPICPKTLGSLPPIPVILKKYSIKNVKVWTIEDDDGGKRTIAILQAHVVSYKAVSNKV